MRRTFFRIQNTNNSHHFSTLFSSFVQLISKISSFYSLINKVLHNQLIKISNNEAELVQNKNMIKSKMLKIKVEVEIQFINDNKSEIIIKDKEFFLISIALIQDINE